MYFHKVTRMICIYCQKGGLDNTYFRYNVALQHENAEPMCSDYFFLKISALSSVEVITRANLLILVTLYDPIF